MLQLRNAASTSSGSTVTSRPPYVTLPNVARSSVPTIWRSVVLPDPDTPTTPTISPEARENEIPLRTSMSPPRFPNVFLRSATRTAAALFIADRFRGVHARGLYGRVHGREKTDEDR